MMEFIHSEGKVRVNPKTLTLDSLLEIYEKDNSVTKESSTRLLTYIHLTSQIDSDAPFSKASPFEVKELVIRNTWRRIPDRMPTVEKMEQFDPIIEEYQQAFETAEHRAVRIFDEKIDQITNKVKDTDPEIDRSVSRGGVVSFKTNIDIIMKSLSEVNRLFDAKEQLEQRIQRKSTEDAQLMGSKKMSILEKHHHGR